MNFVLKFSKGHLSNMYVVLLSLILAYHIWCPIFVPSIVKISQSVAELLSGHSFPTKTSEGA